MQPYFWRPDPQPQQRRPNATLPAVVGDEPPRRGPLAVVILAAAVAAWPIGGQAQVPHRELSHVFRRQMVQEFVVAADPVPPRTLLPGSIELAWRVVWGAQSAPHMPQGYEVIDPPPPRPPMLVPVSVGGVFYPQVYAVPMRLPSGLTPSSQVDAPSPRVPLPPQILERWVPTWDAQRVRMLTPPSGAVVATIPPPAIHLQPAILRAWSDEDAVHLQLPQPGTPEPSTGDTPPPRITLPSWLWRAWERDWLAQSGPTFDVRPTGEQPQPFRPLPPQILRAWVRDWTSQRASVSAAWDVPPQAPGDDVITGRIFPLAVLQAWQPRFILPPPLTRFPITGTPGDTPPVRVVEPRSIRQAWAVDWLAQRTPLVFTPSHEGDQPPPFVRLPLELVRSWERQWLSQHAVAFHSGLTVPPSVIKGLIVRHVSGTLYQVTSVGDQFYLVRIT